MNNQKGSEKHFLDLLLQGFIGNMFSLLLLLIIPSSIRYLLLGTHQLPLNAFERSLQFLGETEIDIDEVQCIVANLIDKVSLRVCDLVLLHAH